MQPSVLPLISETDYPGFQRLIGELVHTSYQEWREDHLKAVAYRTTRNGSQEVPISPREFDQWLQQNEMTPHLELLWTCTEEKARRFARSPSVMS